MSVETGPRISPDLKKLPRKDFHLDTPIEVTNNNLNRLDKMLIRAPFRHSLKKSLYKEIEPLQMPQNPLLPEIIQTTRDYFTDEFQRAGVPPSKHIQTLSPVFTTHAFSSSDSEFVLGSSFNGVATINVPNTQALGSTAQALVTAHEMSHAAASKITLDYIDLFTLDVTHQMGLSPEHKRRSSIKISKLEAQVIELDQSKPSFVEDQMADWDARRIYQRLLTEKPTMLQISDDLRSEVDAFMGSEDMQQLQHFGKDLGIALKPQDVVFTASMFPRVASVDVAKQNIWKWELAGYNLIQGIARAIGINEAENLEREVTNEEAIEMGRQILQKSRLSHSTDAKERMTKIFGEEITEKIFPIEQDRINEAADIVIPALNAYEYPEE